MKTINDLILELEQIKYRHGDLPVLVDGYEEDYDAANMPRVVETADKGDAYKKENWWSGRYIEGPDMIDGGRRPGFKAVVIPR